MKVRRAPPAPAAAWIVAAALVPSPILSSPARAEAGPAPPTLALAPALAQAYPAGIAPAIVALRLNGVAAGDGALVLREGPTRFLVARRDASRLRLALEGRVRVLAADGETWFALEGDGLATAFDEATQTLSIEVSPDWLLAERLAFADPSQPAPARPAWGGFLSYDLLAQDTVRDGRRAFASGQGELGVFTPHGVLTHSALGRAEGSTHRGLRLETTFTVDRPEAMATLRLGDGLSRASGFAPNARFGGVQYGTNFATQPGLSTWPRETMAGRTSLPSTVDIYVDNVLAGTQSVPAGPFTLDNLPTIGGQGELRLVVRDLLGREQVYSRSLYGSTSLLRAGLTDFGLQAGWLRRGFGISSAGYGPGFASGLVRHGVNDALTVEAAAEAARDHGTASVLASAIAGTWGQFTAGTAFSRRRPDDADPLPADRADDAWRSGVAGQLAWERRSRTLSLGAQARVGSRDFLTVAGRDVKPLRREVTAFGSYALGFGTAALAYAHLERHGEARSEFVQASLSWGLRDLGFLSFAATHSLSGRRSDALALTWTVALDARTSASATASRTRDDRSQRDETRLIVQRSVPAGEGWGWRADLADPSRALADVRWNGPAVQAVAEAARLDGRESWRAGLAGSFALVEGELSAARRVEEAFGLVQVPGFEGVRVYLDNQLLGRTDAKGNLLAPRLRPYEANRLSIEQADLPLSAEVGALRLEATPWYKSGVLVRFPVRDSRGALVRVVDAEGRPLPPGSVAILGDPPRRFPVGAGGEAWLTGLAAANRVTFETPRGRCTIDVRFEPGDDPLPVLGPFTCRLAP